MIFPACAGTGEFFSKLDLSSHYFGNCKDLPKPQRQKCSDQALLQYLAEKIKYPAVARENGIQGTVVIDFIVDENGNLSKTSIIKDIGGGCGAEALRIVQNMPKWSAGRQGGRKVKVQMKLPVRFTLQ